MVEPLHPRAQRMVWGVAALLHAVSDTLAARFSSCTLRGEISGFSRASSGHCYLNLKDADGAAVTIRCAMFRRAASLLDFMPADGQLVEVRGRLGLYEPRGELQFVIESMQRAGAGALFEQFLKLKAKLEAEGLFDAERKRTLPAYPRKIGVVTSLGAAVLRDVVSALARRAPHVELIVYPSLVQGAEAPAALVAALSLAARRAEVDVLIVCRGGGSLEDLWSFNDERVVRAMADSPMPVVCGVGHETDVTLADFAADLRAPTPTAAAELVTLTQQECMEMLSAFASLLASRVHRALDTAEQRLDKATLRWMRPAESLRRQAQHLALLRQRLSAHAAQLTQRSAQRERDSSARLRRAMQVSLSARHQRLQSLEARLASADPKRVLARGYAWLTDEAGRAVTSAGSLQPGQQVHAVLVDGEATAIISDVQQTTASN